MSKIHRCSDSARRRRWHRRLFLPPPVIASLSLFAVADEGPLHRQICWGEGWKGKIQGWEQYHEPLPYPRGTGQGQWTAVMMVVGPAACEEVRFGDGDGNSVTS
uniref:Uncharacterized protein n=1 Tax=Oryza sativa subsp. japonica TaxID=39947 RepID=Q6Z546_ORYSJ|nr:hypothetical protein [Oryza sativa Japonica Group]BAC99714.1 hypothetical protein [Oryza sativa Japonica Group]